MAPEWLCEPATTARRPGYRRGRQTVESEETRMPRNPHERPVKPHTIDKREDAQRAIHDVVSRPSKPERLDRADRGIYPGNKPA